MADVLPRDELKPTGDLMPPIVERFAADREALGRAWPTPWSSRRRERLTRFGAGWLDALEALEPDLSSSEDRADWQLLRAHILRERRELEREEELLVEMESLAPFLADLAAVDDDRRAMLPVDPGPTAERLHAIALSIRAARSWIDSAVASRSGDSALRAELAARAARAIETLAKALEEWYGLHEPYDPAFRWWLEAPYGSLAASLKEHASFLRARIAGATDGDAIIGDPVGRAALVADLTDALIPHTPEELIAIARREMAWCDDELRRASKEMGLGGSWQAAIELVKGLHESPGAQPGLVRDLALEAINWLTERDLVSIPPLCEETWRMEMMSAERQKVSPFFLGGETIIVSYPTYDMDHERKRMSMRGNNRFFSRATVQHELIPGHHLQGFAQERHRPYRRLFNTPFWTEGWALHWEMVLYDAGFAATPEDRVGMLFWRRHRCSRVLFSLGFHMGLLTPEECITMLVEEVGHERANAEAEVRRSFGGDYPPLYQCAYLIGGLQLGALRRECRAGGMSDRDFHDGVLRRNCMPIPLLRALMTGAAIPRDLAVDWRWDQP